MKTNETSLQESVQFLTSFSHAHARNLVGRILRHNYAEGIFTHHPKADTLNKEEIQQKTDRLIDWIWKSIESCGSDPHTLFPVLRRLSRSAVPSSPVWFPEFSDAYHHYKHSTKLPRRMHQLGTLIQGPSFCDIGCGGGDWLLYAVRHHPSIREAVGIDVLDWRSEEVAGEIDFLELDFSKPKTVSPREFDSATCLAVLHHVVPNRIRTFLHGVSTALRPGGVLVVEEDVLLDASDIRHELLPAAPLQSLREAQPFFDEYLKLPVDQQYDVLVLIDLLGNALSVGVPDMPFPFGFRRLSVWLDLFMAAGFRIRRLIPAGFVAGNFNQSAHIFFQMERPA